VRRAWLLVAFMWVAYLLNYSDRQAVFSIFPVLKSELGFTDAQLGLTGSVFLWVYALCSPIAGQIGDRFSKRKLVVVSLLLWSAVTALTGLARSPGLLLACRALIGVTESLFFPAAIALLATVHGTGTRSRAVACFGTAQLAGVVLGGWYGGYMAQEYHWRAAFYSLGLVGILYALPYARFLKGVDEKAPVETRASSGGLAVVALARTPTYLVLCAVFPMFTFVLWLLYTWLPNLFYEKYSLSLAAAGFTATAYVQGATIVGLLLGGVLADRLYRRTRAARLWLIGAGLLICAPCVHALGNADTLLAAKLAAVGFGLGSGLFMDNLMISSFEVVPADTRASAAGVLNLIGGAVGGAAALLGGAWKEKVGLSTLMSVAGLLCLSGAVILALGVRAFFRRDYERVHTPST